MNQRCDVSVPRDYQIIKRNGIYYFRFRDPVTGKVMSGKSSRLRNRDAAIAWAVHEYEKIKERYGSSTNPYRDWAAKFFTSECPHISRVLNEGKTYADSTRDDNRKYLEILLEDPIADIPLNEITRPDVVELQDRLVRKYGRTRKTQMLYSTFRITINEAAYRGKIPISPCAGLKQISYKKKPRQALGKEDMEKFLSKENWDNETHWKMTMTARYTGMRAGEIRGLFWEDIDKVKKLIYVRHNLPQNVGIEGLTDPKWGKRRIYPYTKELSQILESDRKKEGLVFAKDGKPIDYWAWLDSVKNARNKSGAKGGIHALRHTINTELASNGVSRDIRKALFGWSNDSTADGYTHAEMFEISSYAPLIEATVSPDTPKPRRKK